MMGIPHYQPIEEMDGIDRDMHLKSNDMQQLATALTERKESVQCCE